MKQGIHTVFRILGFQFKRENESFCFRGDRERERELWWAKIMGLKLYFEIWNLLWVLGGKPVRFYFN